ncbi:hypothetical protein IY230_00755 [Acholeplasma laidlawii]|uniref:Rnf-Nqr domain containing protein n=1 Tax=Acholeplasma laidlawii TaxID=2148 RepID=UPI0018C34124|nr:Rnf-Nqr domain containing protein [Acholeplasma laidlawii]MBG0762142.1 hypothetical protein [Acholeplasma laidlawii]
MNKNNLKPFILLSILPLIYLANTLETALFMGLVYVILALIIYAGGLLINKFSEGRMRSYAYILLTASIVTIIMTVLGTYFSLNQLMGIYLALTIFTIPQLRLETVEEKSILDHGLMILVGFVALVLIGFLREFLGTGSIGLLAFGLDTVQVFDAKFGIAILKDNSGGFILAGFIFAIINAIPFVKEDKADVI